MNRSEFLIVVDGNKYFRRFGESHAKLTSDISKATLYRQKNTALIAAGKLAEAGYRPVVVDKQARWRKVLDDIYAQQKAKDAENELRKAQLRNRMTEKMLSECVEKVEQVIPASMLRYMIALSIPVYPKDITTLEIKRQVPISSSKLSSIISFLSTSDAVRIAEYGRKYCYPDEKAMEAAIRLTESDEMPLDDAEDTVEELLDEVLENGIQKSRTVKIA